MDWAAAVLLWIGNFILIKRKHWFCFVVFGASNLIWIAYWLPKREWAAFFISLTFLAQNVWGVVSWRRQAKAASPE